MMEPMTLGSPVNSPGSGQHYQQQQYQLQSPHQHAAHPGLSYHPATPGTPMTSQTGGPGSAVGTPSGQTGTGFLPGFLMGDYAQQVGGITPNPWSDFMTKSRAVKGIR